jgi:hypothetical protein
MPTDKKLYENISFEDINNALNSGTKDISFMATGEQVNILTPDVKERISRHGRIQQPPYLDIQELKPALSLCNLDTLKGKWDYIVLQTYIHRGKVYYGKGDVDGYYFIEIKVPGQN